MSFLCISDKFVNNNNLLYISESLSKLLYDGGKIKVFADRFRAGLTLNINGELEKLAREDLIDKISDVITVGYKFNFFKNKIKLSGMKPANQQLLLASIISADFDDDKRYVKNKLSFVEDRVAIDGFYEFRLKNLRVKWEEIANFIPEYFADSELKSFIIYLISEKRGKVVIIDGERVYDRHLNRLKRAELLPGNELKIVTEVLLSGASEVQIKGALPFEDEFYLKEYFGDKICINPH